MTEKKWDYFEFRFIDVENDLNDTNYSWISNLPIWSITSIGFYFLTEPQKYLTFILASTYFGSQYTTLSTKTKEFKIYMVCGAVQQRRGMLRSGP